MSMDGRLGGQGVKLPMMATLRAAYAMVFGNLGALFALAAIPFAITIAGKSILFVPPSLISDLVENSGGGVAVELIVRIGILLVGVTAAVVPWIVFVVAWHRFVLLGKRDSRRPLEHYFGLREANFFGNELFLSLFLAACGIFSFFVAFAILVYPDKFPPSWQPVIFLTLFLIASARILFLDPAMAVGHEMDLRTAWRRSRGAGWRLFWILFLVATPFDLLYHLTGSLGAGIVAQAAPTSQEFATDLSLAMVQGLVLFFGTALFVTALCLAYQHVIGNSARPKAQATKVLACLLEFILTLIFGVVAGAAGYGIAEVLTLPAKEQYAMTAAACLLFLAWRAYRTEN